MPYCGGALRDRWAVKRGNLVSAVARILAAGAANGMIRDDPAPEVLANILLGHDPGKVTRSGRCPRQDAILRDHS